MVTIQSASLVKIFQSTVTHAVLCSSMILYMCRAVWNGSMCNEHKRAVWREKEREVYNALASQQVVLCALQDADDTTHMLESASLTKRLASNLEGIKTV